MNPPLRVLLIEDDERDAALVLRVLGKEHSSFEHRRVDNAADLELALDEPWHVILCDYSMPGFDAPSALAIVRRRGLDIPFIIVSGSVGEDTAVAAMRAGAHDYFLKSMLGSRLNAAIERELREAAHRAERRKIQEQLVISDRMASMGTLAAGVAHEINNPLASVMANLELAVRALARTDPGGDPTAIEVREELQDACEAAARIRDIVRDLRVFSRSDDDEMKPVDVRKVLESTLRMARNEIRHRARLTTSFTPGQVVQGSESKLGQVFLNLVVNAAQAIPEGHVDRHEIRITTQSVGPEIVIEISDTGGGIAPDVMSRLFQPFFTTKPAGVGTGLGLSISHRIVAAYGGRIEVDSRVGVGTCFRVVLPSALPRSDEEAASVPAPIAAPYRGRVLVVEAETAIVRAIERGLADEHDVTAVNRGALALAAVRAGAQFDVILCDLLMPEMSGMDLHDELTRLDERQARRVVFLTGGAFTARSRAFLESTTNSWLEKPFTTAQLRAVVNERIRLEDPDE